MMIDDFGVKVKQGDRIVYVNQGKYRKLLKATVELVEVKMKWNGDTQVRMLVNRDKPVNGVYAFWLRTPSFMIINDCEVRPESNSS